MEKAASRYDIKPPKAYLSFSNGKYRIINQGLPVNADCGFKHDAISFAVRIKLKLADVAWNGDRGEWVHLHTIES